MVKPSTAVGGGVSQFHLWLCPTFFAFHSQQTINMLNGTLILRGKDTSL
jgi:hypothetical protein